MNPKVKKVRHSKEEMISFVEEWKVSGESKKSFCTSRNISHSVFHYWFNKLEYEGRESIPGFVEVKPSLRSSAVVPIEIIFPSGAKIVLASDTDPAFIRSIVY